MKIQYITKRFNTGSMRLIEICDRITEEYGDQGFTLTLRQLYYQLVSRDIIPNQQTEYKRLGSLITNARLAGLINWLAIEDRTRNVQVDSFWGSPAEIVESAIRGYKIDLWRTQKIKPEVWIEKDALTGVIAGVCEEWRTPYLSCRGYISSSEIWRAGIRAIRCADLGQEFTVIHLADHDPSGMDMTRDIRERLSLLSEGSPIRVVRIALNWDQVEEYQPPPNPAKVTDSRFEIYQQQFGDDSWELDALEPSVLVGLIQEEIESVLDQDAWEKEREREEEHRAALRRAKESMIGLGGDG